VEHTCVEKAVAAVSSETMKQLDELLVEGYLLEVDVDEQRSLHRVLSACDADLYSVRVFKFEVCYRVCNSTSVRWIQ